MHIYVTSTIFGIYTVNKSSDLWSDTVKKKAHLMWLDGRELNTLQKCKLERPIKIAGLEQCGSMQANPKASSDPSCF